MWIKGPNRLHPLSIPVARRDARAPIKDKKISYAENWQIQHWRALTAAYNNSPYFEYYKDEFRVFFEKKPVFLVDLLTEVIALLWKKLGMASGYELTQEYLPSEAYQKDFRKSFSPRPDKTPNQFVSQSYPQVFTGFDPGLSVIDLLFNEGPNSRIILATSWKAENA